jgi:hypothetical protein
MRIPYFRIGIQFPSWRCLRDLVFNYFFLRGLCGLRVEPFLFLRDLAGLGGEALRP